MADSSGGERVAAAHLGEHEHVEEVHSAEDQQDDSNLGAFKLDDRTQVGEGVSGFECQGNVAHVDEVEADDEELIHGIGKVCVAVKRVEEEDSAAAMECAGDPNGEGDADGQIAEVASGDIHNGNLQSLF